MLRHNDVIAVGEMECKIFRFKHITRFIVELPEQILQKYYVSKVLGEGAFGTVYHVHDYSTGQPFALKKMKNMSHTNDEIEILDQLDHPCIAKMMNAQQIEGPGP